MAKRAAEAAEIKAFRRTKGPQPRRSMASAAVGALRRMLARGQLIPGSHVVIVPHVSAQAGKMVVVDSTPVLFMGEHMERQLKRARRFIQSAAADRKLARTRDMPHHIRCAASLLVALEPMWKDIVWDPDLLYPVRLSTAS